MYSFGVLIPVISIYLIWLKREDLNSILKKPDKIVGFAVLAAGLAVLILGKFSSILVIQEFSLIVSIIGIVLILLGRHAFYMIWFPVLYLIFMIPFWNIILDPLHFPFQIISATLGVKLLNILGIPVFQTGQYLELPNMTLEVAELCSGVNYLISILAIGIPLCYLYLKSWTRRFALLSFAVLVAILSNSLRVAGVALFTFYGGITSAANIHGPFDIFRSLIISAVGILVLCLGVAFLKEEKGTKKGPTGNGPLRVNSLPGNDSDDNSGASPILPFIALVLIAFVGYTIHTHAPVPVPLEKSFSGFPYNIEGWAGIDTEPSYAQVNFKEMGVSDELSRSYADATGRKLHLYVGYFNYQDQEKELINNKLDKLFKYSNKFHINLSKYDLNDVNIFYVGNGLDNKLILHWFDINGKKTINRVEAKGYVLKDSILYNKTNAAIIMVQSVIEKGEDKDSVLSECKEFIETISPLLSSHIPNM
jgi:EpsI family protein